jgi:hypothetical protein
MRDSMTTIPDKLHPISHLSLGDTIWSANFVLCWLFPVFEGGAQKEKKPSSL